VDRWSFALRQPRDRGGKVLPVFEILCVCTGNICRSPAAEILLARNLDNTVTVTSAGTRGMPAWGVSEPMAAFLGPDAPDVAAFRSSVLSEQDVRRANLILAMSAEHKRAILELEPLAMRRTFTLGELARLASAVPPQIAAQWQAPGITDAQRLEALLNLARDLRRQVPSRAEGDDVVDPYGQGNDVYIASYQQLTAFISVLLNVLHGPAQ